MPCIERFSLPDTLNVGDVLVVDQMLHGCQRKVDHEHIIALGERD